MGEFADMEIDRILSNEHEFGGLFSYGRDYPTSIRCKKCGSGPFEWENFGTNTEPKWRLVDDDGEQHACPPLTPAKLGFEDIS